VTPWSDQDFIVCRPETSSVPPSGTIADEMTNPVICVAPEVPLAEVGRLFIDQDIGGAPVVDPDGRPIGMVSRLDIVRTLGSEGEAGGRDAGDMTAGDVMTPVVFTLPETTPMTRAAALMAHDYLHRLPVVDKDGVVVGIVTSSDFLRWMGDRYGL
jgi:CBS domain-containing protein